MQSIFKAWSAMIVRRWHTHEKLSMIEDLTGAHSSRVLVLALRFNPKLSREGIIYAVTHDIGEKGAGDFPYLFKKENPDLAAQVTAYEEKLAASFGFPVSVDQAEGKLIKLCDWLDSYLWAQNHRPDVTRRTDWQEQLHAIRSMAYRMGILSQLEDLLLEAAE